MTEDDQAVHARGFEPTDRKVSGIEAATLTSLLTRSGTVPRSWRDCRVEVLGEGLFSIMRPEPEGGTAGRIRSMADLPGW